MHLTFFFTSYATWHYGLALQDIFHIWLNFMRFTEHVFGLGIHTKNLFAPWHRMTETRTKKWNLEALATQVVINTISRLLGFTLRSLLIISSFICMFALSLGMIVVYIFWIFAPILLTAMIAFGIMYLVLSLGYTYDIPS